MRRCKRTAARDWGRQCSSDRQGWRSEPSLSSEPDRKLRASRTALPVLVPYESKGHNMTIGCDDDGFCCPILKKRLTGPMRLSDFLDQFPGSNDIDRGGNR